METIVCIVAAFVIGAIVGAIVHPKKKSGYLRIDHSDEDGPFLFLELNMDLYEVASKKSISLIVKNEDFIPRN